MAEHDDLVRRAAAREPDAVRELVGLLRPTIQLRAVRSLIRNMRGRRRSTAQEVEDLVQEVFLALFDDDARALRAWDPARLPLAAFVGVIADHEVASIFRSGRRRPYRDEEDGAVEPDTFASDGGGAEAIVECNETLSALLARLRAELSPKGLELFHALLVDEQPVEEVCASTGMTRDAVYAWKSRLGKLVRRLAAELRDSSRKVAAAQRSTS
ncbi:MAG: sigma-70 family RNA polymerase sigma factor [Deltaproteobacteria bacterium]|nr:sigma-70 family RNA polymerase sigma factor [Deltaproteobacteria bacterium]